MMLMSEVVEESVPESLRNITYGTERMDQPTLDVLEVVTAQDLLLGPQRLECQWVGIVCVKSEARKCFMKAVVLALRQNSK